ncbi:IS91 family transposase [Clostridium estertheticum]|uniref:IS91 family transposase n=1 Tax=Clostridium estertheticum TaxID=238834 RepID=UPI001C7DD4C9|nr:IS91 family transposase [Clostridium estertheticum]MBX4267627.1 IS91 family transposase [Clostridium estertheticum]WLC88641.1 IS91 family transposase [Clostridium estertheticum]WLC89909.1 IS91 family transposase [Clostridium estertheticum]
MIEVQDIFQQYGTEYRKKHKLSLAQLKAMSAIEKCRTSQLGGHIDKCENCGSTQTSYNSCRNRHCPKCQSLANERWIDSQKSNLLNIGYFHVIFTIPDTINLIVYQNQKELYTLLFKAVAETLSELASDKKYLGATLGFTSILHTWGQNLMHHPHIHCIVPGGGLSSIGKWVSSRKKFFIPVKVLSRKFRGKFIYYLKQIYYKNKLKFYGTQEYLCNNNEFEKLISSIYSKEWVVYCKPPFKQASCVVEYLGRYTHRVAISNNRIINIENDNVTFKWGDYKDSSKCKLMTVSADEFIRRFIIHILPSGFMKIRHYGLLGNRNKNTKLTLCKHLTNTPILLEEKISALQLIQKITGRDFSKCQHCGSDKLSRCTLFSKSPPTVLQTA